MRTFLAAFLLSAGLASAATVDSVVVRQRWPWSRKVDIDYTLVTDKPCQVVVNVYRDGTLLPMPDAAFSGDRLCVTGAKLNTVVFDPTLTPYDGEVLENLRFELVPREFPPYLIIDVSKDKTDPAQVTWVTAYDLTNDRSLSEHATTVNFRGLPTDEDLIAVGTNTKMSRPRCLQIIDEVKTATKELQ